MGIERAVRMPMHISRRSLILRISHTRPYKSLPLKGRETSPGNSVTDVLNVEKLGGKSLITISRFSERSSFMSGEVKVKRVSVMQIKVGTFSQSAAEIPA